MRVNLRWIISAVVVLLLTRPAFPEDALQQGLFQNISLHGFLQGNYSGDASYPNPDGSELKLAEERVQLRLDASEGSFRFFLKTDAFYDHLSEGAGLDCREGFVDYTSSKWSATIGRQVITWGVGDLLFINDVFPKNYAAFFSGRPLEYLKDGVDGAKIGIYPDFASFELVVIPFFTPDTFPSPNRFWEFGIPIEPSSITNGNGTPSTDLKNTQFALRAYREIAGFDASVYLYRGFYGQSSIIPVNPATQTKLMVLYPELSDYGASLQRNALGGVLSLETGYYDMREESINPTLPRSQVRSLVGYQKQLWTDFTVGVQYYREDIDDRSAFISSLPPGYPQVDDLQLTTIRLTQFLRHETLKLSFFAFYNPSEGDYMLNPEIRYSFSDHVWAAVGANLFGGPKATQFGQLRKDNNVYTQLRYEF